MKKKYKIALIAICLCIIAFISLPFLGIWLMTKGELPSAAQAISIQSVVLNLYSDRNKENVNLNPAQKPDALWKLNPLHIDEDKNGILVIFKKRFVTDYGYYFCKKGCAPSPKRKAYCREKVAKGIYFYFNPG